MTTVPVTGGSEMINNLCLSGGGIKAAIFIGCYEYLFEHGKLRKLHNLIGSSGGAIICFMIALDFSPQEMKDFVLQNIYDNQDGFKIDVTKAMLLIVKYGIDDGERFRKLFIGALKHKLGSDVEDISFIDFTKKTGKNLVICGSNITEGSHEYFNVDSSPDMSVITALRISISIPIVFTPVRYNDCVYIDSGIYNNFPINYFEKNKGETFGLNLISAELDTKTFWSYIWKIIATVLDKRDIERMKEYKNSHTIRVQDTNMVDMSKMTFNLKKDDFDTYVEFGRGEMIRIFELGPGPVHGELVRRE